MLRGPTVWKVLGSRFILAQNAWWRGHGAEAGVSDTETDFDGARLKFNVERLRR